DVALFEVAHHTTRRIEAEDGTAGQEDSMHSLDEVARLEQVGLARAWSSTSNIYTRNGALTVAEYHRTPSASSLVLGVSHSYSGNIGDGALGSRVSAMFPDGCFHESSSVRRSVVGS